MRNMTEIQKIVREMSEERFDKINDAENDYWSLNKRISNNGYKRLVYHLNKVGITVDEWFAWCDL